MGIRFDEGICNDIPKCTDPSVQSDGIALNEAPQSRVVIPEVVVIALRLGWSNPNRDDRDLS